MRTVSEVSKLTGISGRTLRFYDEMGLLKPSGISEARYRLYDDKALETLQQILFFKEFDMPLKEIKAILNNPEIDNKAILKSQQQVLQLKQKRLNSMIAHIDNLLKGDNVMDFEVFSKEDLESIFHQMMSNMLEEQKQVI